MLAPRSWLRLPRRTVRLRLTALYGALFLVSGAVLLAITYGLVVGRPQVTAFRVVSASGGVVKAVAGQVSRAVRVCTALQVPCPPLIKGFPVGAGSAGGAGGAVQGPVLFRASLPAHRKS